MPTPSGGIDHPDNTADEPRQAAQSQPKQNELSFLPAVELLAAEVRENALVEAERQEADEDRHENPAEQFCSGHHADSDPVNGTSAGNSHSHTSPSSG